MSLKIYLPPSTTKVERPNIVQRLAAFLGLAGLVLAWAVVLAPCAVWLLFSLVLRRPASGPARQRA
jgi:hypothetical protein